jgi:hypothetical protein
MPWLISVSLGSARWLHLLRELGTASRGDTREALDYAVKIAGSQNVGEPRKNADPTYRLAAEGREAAEDERLSLLESIFDPTSRRRRSLVKPGWRCLRLEPDVDRWQSGLLNRSVRKVT